MKKKKLSGKNKKVFFSMLEIENRNAEKNWNGTLNIFSWNSESYVSLMLKLTLSLLLPLQFSVLKCLCNHCKKQFERSRSQIGNTHQEPGCHVSCQAFAQFLQVFSLMKYMKIRMETQKFLFFQILNLKTKVKIKPDVANFKGCPVLSAVLTRHYSITLLWISKTQCMSLITNV